LRDGWREAGDAGSEHRGHQPWTVVEHEARAMTHAGRRRQCAQHRRGAGV